MDAMDCLISRRSVRRFRKEEIFEVDINDIIDAGVAAPSSGNSQDWDFILVKNPDIKSALTEASMGQTMINEAEFVIVACSNESRNKYGERGRNLYSIQNCAAAVENMMLAAWSKGIGSCWIGAFNEGKVKDILSIPNRVRPLAIVVFGFPSAKVKKPSRLSRESVLHKERF